MTVHVQGRTPLADGLAGYAARRTSRFHTPGHAGGRGWPRSWSHYMSGAGRLDVTELPSLAGGRSTADLVHEAEALAAALCGAERTFFLSGGSTLGLQAVVLSAAGPGDDVILPRNAHQSVIHSLVICGANPVYMPVPSGPSGVPLGVTVETLRAALQQARRPRLVVLLSPSYHGLCVDLPGLVQEAHRFGVPVLVDEAHGGHFLFHDDLPMPARESGPDAWVQSAHKTLGALTGAALLHIGRGAIDPGSVQRTLEILSSTSPSYLLLASLDVARWEMWRRGRSMWGRAIRRADTLRELAGSTPGVTCIGPAEVGCGGITEFDRTRLVFTVQGMSGWHAARLLRQAKVEAEYADARFVCLIIPYTIGRIDVIRFAQGLRRIAREAARHPRGVDADAPAAPPPAPGSLMTPREAALAPREWVSLSRAEGRVAAATVALCPPGVPILCPGELVTPAICEFIHHAARASCGQQAVEGLCHDQVAVVAEGAVKR